MPQYFAHSTEDPARAGWQPLAWHLQEVSRRAGVFSDRFGAEAWGNACGLLHDLGKYSQEFQDRLQGGKRVDHATAGARQAVEIFGPALGMLVAYAVAGHHSGLPDGGVGGGMSRKTLHGRLEQGDIPAIRDFESLLEALPCRLSSPPVPRQGFSVAFFVRMLFSCLVDADFLDTEAWLAPTKSKYRQGYPTVRELLAPLDRHLDGICRSDTPVNERRAEILANCRVAAALKPGLFSLTVPTGGGKTLSSLAFALRHAVLHGLDRVVYAIPYTSIIEQNVAVFRQALGELGSAAVLEHHSSYRPAVEDDDAEDGLALRARLAAENWDAPIVVTTNVQLFESLFAARSSRCRKLHNLARSVVILDEAQMLPASLLQPCLAALRDLVASYGTTVVLCTATQPALHQADYLPRGFSDEEIREIIPDHASLYEAFRRVSVTYVGAMSDNEVAGEVLSRSQVLCIVNTRAHARKLYEALGPGEGHFHLSALLCPAHRAKKLAWIRDRLARGKTCRVVSTQLIEAGVDVDFPYVLRAACGIDSVAQAAGRCNREGRLPGGGEVTVFDPECGLPAGHFRRTADVGAMTARAFPDLLSPEAIRHYFTQLYSFEGADGLDQKQILPRLEESAGTLSFPFREIAEEFRLIEHEMESLIIPWREGAESDVWDLVQELRYTDFPAATARKLQPYTIQVYRRTMGNLMAAGVVETVADRFHILINDSLYRDDLGLCPEDPMFREQENNIF
ncbi:MAG: CRISPR-associated helicase Cas3' [Thermodesulfobacteriota bacterium]